MNWLEQLVHLSDLPTWLTAIGAFIAAWFAVRQFRGLREQNHRQQRELESGSEELGRIAGTQRRQAELLDLEIRDRRLAQARLIQVHHHVLPGSAPAAASATASPKFCG